ncbi:DUF2383 domain-containing protein [Wansuia hejianensis]|uniref:DUF2383 domain-containing protein n=1 Tax=Wansuia hejianensis TaxID=2763667 RepID=A0A926F0Q3_9FIRM|nr:DUF2383 domain-containing protein [Wansuia hejianensis]MBC8589867.1 DUF2383 domain-containing protein [Wansuia hejianensis]
MIKDSETIKSLNELLQGEYMAVESFNNFISKIEDEKVKNVFQSIQKQHRDNINILAEYIQELHGKPDENLGLKGKMADIKLNMKLDYKDINMVIEKAIEGETKGVNMAEKILRGNLDEKSRKITGQILENDRQSIHSLEKLKN